MNGREIRSTVNTDSTVRLSLAEIDRLNPSSNQVLIRVEAAPINPSDIGLLLGQCDTGTLEQTQSQSPDTTDTVAQIPSQLFRYQNWRVGTPMPVGNEGAGVVIAAGDSEAAQSLLGRTVAVVSPGMFSQFKLVDVAQCFVMPEGTKPVECASAFVNPMSALCMLETMRAESHTALVNTAAASNLGRILQKVCDEDGINLVNIVRRPEQAEEMQAAGAKYVCVSSSDSFETDLKEALIATGATLAFDATGGGDLASQILQAMEDAIVAREPQSNIYGSTTHKQIYLYGTLNRQEPLAVDWSRIGSYWGVSGWVLPQVLSKLPPHAIERMKERIANNIRTTFATQYGRRISLRETIQPATIREFTKRSTGGKFLICPNLD